jgi:hypothetical protein
MLLLPAMHQGSRPPAGWGLKLNGSNQLVEVAHSFGALGQGTVAIWAHLTRNDENLFQNIAANGTQLGQALFTRSNSTLRYYVWDGANREATSVGQVIFNRYNHFAATFQNSVGIRLYLNGALVGSAALGTAFAGGTRVLFGQSAPSRGRFCNGRLHDVKLFNRALTLAEVGQLSTSHNQNLTGLTTNLVGDYRLEQRAGLVAPDLSPQGRTGNLIQFSAAQTTPGPGNAWVDDTGQPLR